MYNVLLKSAKLYFILKSEFLKCTIYLTEINNQWINIKGIIIDIFYVILG